MKGVFDQGVDLRIFFFCRAADMMKKTLLLSLLYPLACSAADMQGNTAAEQCSVQQIKRIPTSTFWTNVSEAMRDCEFSSTAEVDASIQTLNLTKNDADILRGATIVTNDFKSAQLVTSCSLSTKLRDFRYPRFWCDKKSHQIVRATLPKLMNDSELTPSDFCIAVRTLFALTSSNKPLVLLAADSVLEQPMNDHGAGPIYLDLLTPEALNERATAYNKALGWTMYSDWFVSDPSGLRAKFYLVNFNSYWKIKATVQELLDYANIQASVALPNEVLVCSDIWSCITRVITRLVAASTCDMDCKCLLLEEAVQLVPALTGDEDFTCTIQQLKGNHLNYIRVIVWSLRMRANVRQEAYGDDLVGHDLVGHAIQFAKNEGFALFASLLFRANLTKKSIISLLNLPPMDLFMRTNIDFESHKFVETEWECNNSYAANLPGLIKFAQSMFPTEWINKIISASVSEPSGLPFFKLDSLLRMKDIYASGELLEIIKDGQYKRKLNCSILGTCVDEVKLRWAEAVQVLKVEKAAAVKELDTLSVSIDERARRSACAESPMDQDSMQETLSEESENQQEVAWELSVERSGELAHQKKRLECEISKYNRVLMDSREAV